MRLFTRIFVLILSAVFALQVIPCVVEWRLDAYASDHGGSALILDDYVTGRSLALVLPALSPFIAIASAASTKVFGWVFLLSLPVLVIAVLNGRWFCFHLCPTGFLSELAGKIRPGARFRFAAWPRFDGIIALFVLGGALFCYPIFLWMDPLRIFNGFFAAWRAPLTLFSILPASGLILIMFLGVWRPNAWCYRVCPLGFLLEGLGKAGRRILARGTYAAAGSVAGCKPVHGVGRRIFLSALAGGIAGFTARSIFAGNKSTIRPPGAIDEGRFTAICVRCGNCVTACPKKIIFPDMGESGIAGFMTPILKIESQYCVEWCHECSKVCPTGAIARVTLAEKNDICIGTARIEKPLCLAWARSQACMVCSEYCPYHAISLVVTENAVPSPVVDEKVCRGCGYCQVGCPAEDKAIVIQGCRQERLKHVDVDLLLSHGVGKGI